MGLFDEVNKAVVNQQQQNNYVELLKKSGLSIPNLKVTETNGKLTVTGTVPDMQTAEKAINTIKTQAGGKEVVNLLELEDLTAKNIRMKVVTSESNLNVRKGPGTEHEIVGKAAHGSTVQLIKKMYNDWYYIKTDAGIIGFCSAKYLQQI